MQGLDRPPAPPGISCGSGEKELVGKGVSYRVDRDGNFYRGEEVAVVGGESAAADGALTLAEIAGDPFHPICDDLKISDALLGKLENSRVVVHRDAQGP